MRSALLVLAAALLLPAAVSAQPGDDAIVDARSAFARKDRTRLAALKTATASHPLAPWTDYWELTNHLGEAQAAEVEGFYGRWPGT